jgi:hypothetical protein
MTLHHVRCGCDATFVQVEERARFADFGRMLRLRRTGVSSVLELALRAVKRGGWVMRRRLGAGLSGLVFVLPMLALLPGRARADSWTLFESHEGRFRVLLPATPDVSTEKDSTLMGDVPGVDFTAIGDGVRARVEIHDVPRVIVLLLPDSDLLRRVGQRTADDRAGRILSEEALTFRGRPARRLRYVCTHDANRVEVALLVLVGQRIYIALVRPLAPGGAALSELAARTVQRFFDSLDFWENPQAGPTTGEK